MRHRLPDTNTRGLFIIIVISTARAHVVPRQLDTLSCITSDTAESVILRIRVCEATPSGSGKRELLVGIN